ncbi:MAG TPA: GNAT family N-acetyltransferase [Actinomycetota bacterium]|nr:GNAT family N-acetyltransferase [Actinomycetota bacterium]
MEIKLRPGTVGDATECGRICYEAFASLATAHGFPPDFPSSAVATSSLLGLLSHPDFYSVVAEQEARAVGSNFLDERSSIAGVGPITVDPLNQDAGIGRELMLDVMDRAKSKGFAGMRLLQAAYHNRSLSLYAKLGFQPRESIATLQGQALRLSITGYEVRPATHDDLDLCNRLCEGVHGHDRAGEVRDAIAQGTARVVEHDGRIVGYTTGVAFFGHSIAESNEGLKALIGDAAQFAGPGFLLPTRNATIFRWCLEHGLRVVQLMTLMTVGLYNEPDGPYLPSILY